MPEAMTATQPAEQSLITDAGDSYNLPGAEAISKYTAATCAKLVDEMVAKNLLPSGGGQEPIPGFSKMGLIERREELIKIVAKMTDNEAAEAKADQKAGAAVEAAALKADPKPAVQAGTVLPSSSSGGTAESVTAPVKVKQKPGPKPGSKKNQKGQVGDNAPAQTQTVQASSDDPIIKMASKIEKIKSRGELENQIREIVDETSLDEFALGGMLAKAQAMPEWWNQSYQSFRDYVETVSGIKYRKAMYCIGMYTSLLKMDKPWSAFQDIGWTKILYLTDILTKDTPDKEFAEWVDKAKIVSVEALKALIANALKPEGEQKPESETEVKSMTFKLHADQREVVEAALETAMKAVSTETKAVGLEAMAQSYLGTGLAFKNWTEALTYARKHTDDPLTFASTVIESLEKLCPELEWPNILLDIRSETTQAAE